LAFTIFWAYAAFFLFMLVWIANRPDEIGYFSARLHGAFGVMSLVLVLGQFVIPFCFLLSYRLKRRGRWLAGIATWIFVMHYLDIHWLVSPTARPGRFPFHWLDLSALFAVGGLSVSAALLSLRGRHLVPIHDPKLAEAMRYESS
jgi:hypothetical protein